MSRYILPHVRWILVVQTSGQNKHAAVDSGSRASRLRVILVDTGTVSLMLYNAYWRKTDNISCQSFSQTSFSMILSLFFWISGSFYWKRNELIVSGFQMLFEISNTESISIPVSEFVRKIFYIYNWMFLLSKEIQLGYTAYINCLSCKR